MALFGFGTTGLDYVDPIVRLDAGDGDFLVVALPHAMVARVYSSFANLFDSHALGSHALFVWY